MRRLTTRSITVAAFVVVAACKQSASSHEHLGAEAPGSGSASPGLGSGSGSPAAHPAGAALLDANALDKALAERHVQPEAVIKRAATPSTAWALIATRDKASTVTAYDLLRVRASEAQVLHIVPPEGNHAEFDPATASLEARDLDGDGHDEALLIVGWKREVKVSDPCEGCFRTQDEEANQLYVVSGSGDSPKTAFTHLVSYTSASESYPEGNDYAAPDPDDIAYDWQVAGSPPILKLTRTKSKIATQDRLKGAIDPATDPQLSSGAGKDIPLALP